MYGDWTESMEPLSPNDLVFLVNSACQVLEEAPPLPYDVCLYEKIDWETFPSSSDYYGTKIAVEEGTPGVIVRLVGRPWKFCLAEDDPGGIGSDIYEVLVAGKIYHALRCWMMTDENYSKRIAANH